MKKSLLLKILALASAAVMFSGVILTAFADGSGDNVTAENEAVTVDGDLHGFACAIATDGEDASLTVNGDVTYDLISGGAAVCVNAQDGGSASIQTGDVTKDNSDDHQDEAGVDAFATGEESQAAATVGDITSDSNGVYVNNEGGSVVVKTGDITAADGNGISIDSTGGSAEVTSDAVEATDIGVKAMVFGGDNDSGSTVDITAVQVNGDITVKNTENDHQAAGVEVLNMNASTKSEVTVDGNIEVKGGKVVDDSTDVGSLGLGVWAGDGSSSSSVNGDITVNGTDNPTGISISAGSGSKAEASVDGNVSVTGSGEACANGITVCAYDSGSAEAAVSGDVSVEGKKKIVGLSVNNEDGNTAKAAIGGNVKVVTHGEEPENESDPYPNPSKGIEVSVSGADKSNTAVEVADSVSVSGEWNAIYGVDAQMKDSSDSQMTVKIDGDVTVDNHGEPSSEGVYVSLDNTTNSSLTVEIGGNIDVISRGPEAVYVGGREVSNSSLMMQIDGDVTVQANGEGGADGVSVSLYNNEDCKVSTAEVILNGNISVTETAGDHATAISVGAGEQSASKVMINGDVKAAGGNACAVGASAQDNGITEIQMTGNATASGIEDSAAVSVSTYGEDSQLTLSLTGDVSADRDKSKMDYTHWEANDCIGLSVGNSGGTANLSVRGEIFATGEDAAGVRISTYNTRENYSDYDGKVNEEEICGIDRQDWVDTDGNKHKTIIKEYYNEEDDFYYEISFTDGVKNDYTPSWRETPVKGSVNAKVIGDVTGEDTGLRIEGKNKKTEIDVLVDGTITGEEHGVVLTEQTDVANMTLTVWKIEKNSAGNVAERETLDKTDASATYTADSEAEKKIQYIIRLDQPKEGGGFSAEGTKEYRGYNVAKEGETVTLKLNIQDGYRITGAYNGTDTKVKLLKDTSGNYYIVVPKGGGVQLSIDLQKITEEKDAGTQTNAGNQKKQAAKQKSISVTDVTDTVDETELTEVTEPDEGAILKQTDETTETTALKASIEGAVASGDILTILPDDAKAKIPEGISRIDGMMTMTLYNYEDSMGAVSLKILQDGEHTGIGEVTVVIALPDGNGGCTWFVVKGERQEDGSLVLNLSADIAKALAEKIFVTMIMK